MHADGVSSDRLKNFVLMEDEFLSMEQQSVCTRIPLIVQAGVLSNKIKDMCVLILKFKTGRFTNPPMAECMKDTPFTLLLKENCLQVQK